MPIGQDESSREHERADAPRQLPFRVGLSGVFAHHLVVDEATVDAVDGAPVPVQRAHRPGKPHQRGAQVEPVARDLAVKFIDCLGGALQVDLFGDGQEPAEGRRWIELPAPPLLDRCR